MKERQKHYFRLTKADRVAIERALDANKSGRAIAREIARSNSTISDEVKRNRSIVRGPGKGQKVECVPDDVCPKLLAWPWVCNGCKYRRYHCSRKWRCEYSAARAHLSAEELLSQSRRGVNAAEQDFEKMMATIRADVARGLSPAQIVRARTDEFRVSASTIYRWIDKGYAGMSNIDLRRKVGYKPRTEHTTTPTPHGPTRSYKAFCDLPKDRQATAAEMDCVIGRKRDTQCLLTIYHRPSKFQLAMPLKEKTSSEVSSALDALERICGKEVFVRLFGVLLTDNGSEFSCFETLERSVFPGKTSRTNVYYCDVRQSQQKAGCERNHVELRKLLPKRRGISFDDLDGQDCAELMSQLNSEPRASLMGLSPIAVLKHALPHEAEVLCDALSIREVPYEELDLTIGALNAERAMRGLPPLC